MPEEQENQSPVKRSASKIQLFTFEKLAGEGGNLKPCKPVPVNTSEQQ
jgi:hypothetical protein